MLACLNNKSIEPVKHIKLAARFSTIAPSAATESGNFDGVYQGNQFARQDSSVPLS